MMKLAFQARVPESPHFLFLGAHCDDIEIGLGGTITALVERYPQAQFHWIVFASNPQRAAEAESSAGAFLCSATNVEIEINAFQESYFPYAGKIIKDHFEGIKKRINPDVIFTHYRDDLHQDHRVISDLTWNSFRSHLILEYEIPKYDGDLARPNMYSPISKKQLDRKASLLLKHFPSQSHRTWFDAETFRSLARIRGIECNAPDGCAEAFFCRKGVFQ